MIIVIGWGGIVLVLGGVFFYRLFVEKKRDISRRLVGTIRVCMKSNMALPGVLCREADINHDKFGLICLFVGNRISAGDPLHRAMTYGFPSCPAFITTTIAAAERAGRLPDALDQLHEELKERYKTPRTYSLSWLLFIVFMALSVSSIITFLRCFVWPGFEEMAYESGLEAHYLIPVEEISLFITAIVVLVAGFLLEKLITGKKRYWVLDVITWLLPGLHHITKNKSILYVTGTLAFSLRSGMSMDDAIENTLSLDLNIFYRKRLKKWLKIVRNGEDVSEAARRCGVGRSLAWMLEGGVNVPRILASFEPIFRTAVYHRIRMVKAFICPLLTLATGAYVAVSFYAYMEVLNSLLHTFYDEITKAYY